MIQPLPLSASRWKLTGGVEYSAGIFGRVIVKVEEKREVYRPRFTGHTPANWQDETRWRRASLSDINAIRQSRGSL